MPPVSATVNQQFQWGAEAVRGGGGAAGKKFSELVPTVGLAGDIFTHMGKGVKGLTSTTQGNKWAEIPFTGPWNFNDLAVLFACHGIYAAPVVTGSVAAWDLEPSLIAENTAKTLVGQYGDTNRVREIRHIIIPTLGLVAARGGLEVNGKMLGQKGSDLGGFTSTPTTLNQATADEVAVDVWVVDDPADLFVQGTKFAGAYKVDAGLNDLYVPDYPLNSSTDSFSGTVEGVPGVSVKITTRTDDEGWALYDAMEAGAVKYLGLEAIGPLISGTDFYSFQFSMPLLITKVPSYEDVDAVYGITFEAGAKVDSNFNSKLYKALITNTLLAL